MKLTEALVAFDRPEAFAIVARFARDCVEDWAGSAADDARAALDEIAAAVAAGPASGAGVEVQDAVGAAIAAADGEQLNGAAWWLWNNVCGYGRQLAAGAPPPVGSRQLQDALACAEARFGAPAVWQAFIAEGWPGLDAAVVEIAAGLAAGWDPTPGEGPVARPGSMERWRSLFAAAESLAEASPTR